MKNRLSIVVPMAGLGTSFVQAGYSFPKPLIDINGKSMIQHIVENLLPQTTDYRFIFVCLREHYEKYSLYELFKRMTKNRYQCLQLFMQTQGAACSVLMAVDSINTDGELLIANSDQIVDVSIEDFLSFSRRSRADASIMTFESNHPKWSYARIDDSGTVLETAEKRVISNHATVGIYYFRQGKMFVEAASSMIQKDVRTNREFYVCPVFNELILQGKKITIYEIEKERMHSLGTPEDLQQYMSYFESKKNI